MSVQEAYIAHPSLSSELDSILDSKVSCVSAYVCKYVWNESLRRAMFLQRPVKSSVLDSDESLRKSNSGIVFPFGCSIKAVKPAQPLLSSKELCFPANRAIGAVARIGRGTLITIGSVKMFDDTFFSKEDNTAFFMALLAFMMVLRFIL
jgi:hypothetical protein